MKGNALQQMVTFEETDLFTNKCPRCQHLLLTDLHNVTELTALICSLLCQRNLPASSHVHLITISCSRVRSKRSTS